MHGGSFRSSSGRLGMLEMPDLVTHYQDNQDRVHRQKLHKRSLLMYNLQITKYIKLQDITIQ